MVPRGARVPAGGRLAAAGCAVRWRHRCRAFLASHRRAGGWWAATSSFSSSCSSSSGRWRGSMPHDFRPCDIGYTRIGVWVADFDETLARLERLGSPPLSRPGRPAGARRACVRNPDGVFVEIMEDDPLVGRRTARRADRPALSLCARSRCPSPTSPGPKPSSPAGSACERSDAALRPLSTRRSGASPARRRAAACSRPAASSSSSCSISIRSGGRAQPAIGSQIRASSTSPSAPAADATIASSTAARARLGRGRTAGRFTCPAGASST